MRLKIRKRPQKSKEFSVSQRETTIAKLGAQVEEQAATIANLRNQLAEERQRCKWLEEANLNMYSDGKAEGYEEGLKKASESFCRIMNNATKEGAAC